MRVGVLSKIKVQTKVGCWSDSTRYYLGAWSGWQTSNTTSNPSSVALQEPVRSMIGVRPLSASSEVTFFCGVGIRCDATGLYVHVNLGYWVLFTAAAMAVTGCHRTSATDVTAKQQPSAEQDALGIGYPKAAWRDQPEIVNDVLIPLAHIVVAHSGSRVPEGRCGCRRSVARARGKLARAGSEPSPTTRAVQGCQRAHRRVCAKVAETASDDSVSAHWGGVLGLAPATTLPEQYLDALSILKEAKFHDRSRQNLDSL